jgi:predicted RNA binding protein YcfA (HicA-like mRNA interferase family)
MRELDFEKPYSGGLHPQMRRRNVTVIIPNSHEGDIGVGFLTRLLRQAGVTHEEWLGKA